MQNTLEQRNSIGRPKTFDKGEVLELAMQHFWEHGYSSSSLDDLLLAMGIKKSSFYSTFKSKKELFSNCLTLYRKEAQEYVEQTNREIGPKKTMLFLSTQKLNELRDTGKVKGCLLINSGQECYKKYEDLSHQIALEFNFMQKLFADLIDEAQKLGEISSKKKAHVISGRYMNALNGLVVTIQAGATEELINDLVSDLQGMLE